MHALRPTIIAAFIVAAVLMLFASPLMQNEPLPPCPTEDSAGPCYWDAERQGNGTGQSFTVNPDGSVTYR